MKSNNTQIFYLFLVTIAAYLANKTLVYVLNVNTLPFKYSVEILHLFFAVFSIVNLLVLQKIKQINVDIVGNTFLLLSSVKMILAYLLVKPILNSSSIDAATEKWHFFAVFIFYLFLETSIVIYLLNSKTVKKAQ